jgi:hypothetical protein
VKTSKYCDRKKEPEKICKSVLSLNYHDVKERYACERFSAIGYDCDILVRLDLVAINLKTCSSIKIKPIIL